MISFLEILNKISLSPKALILAGAPGAGKGSVLNSLNLNVKILNLDDIIADLSKKQGFTLNQKDTDAENRSKFMTAMRSADSQLKNELIPSVIKNKENFILDGTSASIKNTLKLKKQLEESGYEVMMLYIYSDLETILQRNEKRFEKSKGQDRSLMPSAILSIWKSVTNNFDIYKKEFKNFVSVASSGENETLKDINKIFQKYIDPFIPKDGKEKTEKEKERSEKNKEKLRQDLQVLLNSKELSKIINSSVSKEEAGQKIKTFFS